MDKKRRIRNDGAARVSEPIRGAQSSRNVRHALAV